jgi:hypothetical protein
MLMLGLSGFALAQIPFASTLWSEQLTLQGSAGIATSTPTATNTPTNTPTNTATATNTPTNTGGPCEGFITFVGKSEFQGNTAYQYTFTRNAKTTTNCHDMSFIAFQVCFNPTVQVAGPLVGTAQPLGWSYDPDNGGSDKRVKWNASGSINAPLNVTGFSITMKGTAGTGELGPDAQAPYQVHAGDGQPTYENGKTVTVPHPTSCGSTAPLAPLGASVFACTPLKLETGTVKTVDGRTEYSYKFSGGSVTPRAGCPDVAAVVLPVCFNPGLDPLGIVLPPKTEIKGWTYSGHMEGAAASPPIPRAVEWHVSSGLRGPYNQVLTFAIPGEDIPLETIHAIVRDPSGASYDLGEVSVPHPVACDFVPKAPAVEAPTAQPSTVPATVPPTGKTPAATETPQPKRPGNATPEASRPTTVPTPAGAIWYD